MDNSVPLTPKLTRAERAAEANARRIAQRAAILGALKPTAQPTTQTGEDSLAPEKPEKSNTRRARFDEAIGGVPLMSVNEATNRLRSAGTVRELATIFETLQPGRDPARKQRLQFWVEELGDTNLADVSFEQVDEMMAKLETEPTERGEMRSGPTINRYRTAFASLIKFARKRRKLPRTWRSPLEGVENHPENPGVIRYLTPEEEQRLMAAAALQLWPLMPLLVRFALVTGMRKGNLCALTWKDVNLAEGLVVVHRDKRGKEYTGTLTPDLMAALKAIKPANALPTHIVFCGRDPNMPHNFEHAWNATLRDAHVENFTFHCLRHTSCSRLAQAGRNLLEIAEHAGHSNLNTTRRYSHLNTKGRQKMVNEVFGG